MRFVGLKNPDYDSRKTEPIFESNGGGEITTDGIAMGVERTARLFDAQYTNMIKKSSLFVREKE